MRQPTASRGMSLIEVMIAIAIAAALLSGVYSVLHSALRGDRAFQIRSELQVDAVRILREVTETLKRSGPIDLVPAGTFDEGDFPYIWNDGASNAGVFNDFYAFVDAQNPAIVPQAASAYEGAGVSQEIAFRLPRDVDGDTFPTASATGSIEWGTDIFAFVLVPGQYGNELQLRRYDAARNLVSSRVLGRRVERITFETAVTEPKPVLPPQQALGANQIRISAWFRRVDGTRGIYTVRQASTVNQRSVGN